MTSETSAGLIGRCRGVPENSRAVRHDVHSVLFPLDIFGISIFSQHGHRHPVHPHGPLFFIHFLNGAPSPETMNIAAQCTVGAVALHILGEMLEAFAYLPAWIDDETFKGPSRGVMPQRQLADAAQAVDSQSQVYLLLVVQ